MTHLRPLQASAGTEPECLSGSGEREGQEGGRNVAYPPPLHAHGIWDNYPARKPLHVIAIIFMLFLVPETIARCCYDCR